MSNEKESIIFIDWLENSIYNEYLCYYDFSEFKNVMEIGIGSSGIIYRANYKNTSNFFAIKSFYYSNEATLKEIVNEV